MSHGGMDGFRKRRWPKRARVIFRFFCAILIACSALIFDNGRLEDDLLFLVIVVSVFTLSILGDIYSRMPNWSSQAFTYNAAGRLTLAEGLLDPAVEHEEFTNIYQPPVAETGGDAGTGAALRMQEL